MAANPGLTLTATDRVLIHLRDHLHHADESEFPYAITQKGISDATGLRLQHVPRTLKVLEDRGLVCSGKGHVKGEGRRYKVYFLTGQGLDEAGVVLKRVFSAEVATDKGTSKVGDLLDGHKGPLLPELRKLAGEDAEPARIERMIAGPVPDTTGFVNRQRELDELERMLDDPEVRVMVVYGSLGYGTSTLAAEFAIRHSDRWSVAWIEAAKELSDMVDLVSGTVSETEGRDVDAQTPLKLAQALDGSGALLVLDNYYDVSEDIVEYLSGLVAALKSVKGFKMLVTAREDTPPYNRFYTIMDQHDGTVGEVHIRGLDEEHCRELLGAPDIDPDALQRLFLFTRGKPPTLKLLAEGDENELVRLTRFSPEEIKLMLFLKGQRKK